MKAITWTEKVVDLKTLKPYERNPRRISDAAFARLKASIEEMGYHQRIIVQPDFRVIGGHQRIRALQEVGFDKIHVLIPSRELTDKEYHRLLIQDNLPFGEFDMEILTADFTMPELEEWGMPKDWMPKQAPTEGLTDPDAIPELPEEPISVSGDVWRLGGHRLACGDSTKADDVAKLMDGATPHLMVTDPPYGVNYDANWRNEADRKNGKPYGHRAIGKVANDDRCDWRESYALFPGDVAYVWHAGNKANTVADSLIACGFDIRAQIIWVKSNMVISRGHYHPKHEPCWYVVKKGATGHWQGDRKQTTAWEIDKPQKSETGHSTQKPVECMKRPIENNSKPGDLVYEPFSGSGTTIIAAEMMGRKCYAMELSPQYVDLAVKRWQEFTGEDAIHEQSGQTYKARLSHALPAGSDNSGKARADKRADDARGQRVAPAKVLRKVRKGAA